MALGTPDSSLSTNDTSFSCIFSVLSDDHSLKIIDTIASRQQDLKMGDFDTHKRYYSRLSKLKKSHQPPPLTKPTRYRSLSSTSPAVPLGYLS